MLEHSGLAFLKSFIRELRILLELNLIPQTEQGNDSDGFNFSEPEGEEVGFSERRKNRSK